MSYPVIDIEECIACGSCIDACPCDVLELEEDIATVVEGDACVACGACMDACPTGAITEISDEDL